MGIIITSDDTTYQSYMNSIRSRVGVDALALSNEDIDSVTFLQSIEDDFIETLGADFYDNAMDVTKRRIKLYLSLKTAAKIMTLPEYAPIIREAEFGESVSYAEQDLQERLNLLLSEINELALKISPELAGVTDFQGAFEVYKLGAD